MKKAIHLLLLIVTLSIYSQKESNIWYFGKNAGLDFNTTPPTVLSDGQLNTLEGCATISTASGQLLFYTDGVSVWNKNHKIMANGSGLLGHDSATQSAIIVPFLDDPDKFYIFTTPERANPNGFRYSVVDMSLNGGLGDVTNEKNILIKTNVCEKLTAVKSNKNNEYWVVVHGYGDDAFYAYKISDSGIDLNPVVSNIGTIVSTNNNANTVGYLKFSPSGTKVIVCHQLLNIVELFDFDASTGKLSNQRTVSKQLQPYGVEFSKSEKIVYVSRAHINGISQPKLYQYDLTAPNIPSSEVILYESKNASDVVGGALQMAPDGKIYSTGSYVNNLNVINNPEALGLACNFALNAIHLGPTGFSRYGLPQFIQSYFSTDLNIQNLCLGNPTSFSLSNTQNILSINWDFGDATPLISNLTPTHTYTLPGNYTVTANITTSNGITTKSKEITISPTPIANTIGNQNRCEYAKYTYDLTQNNITVLGSQSSTTFGVSYYNTSIDAINNTNTLNNTQTLDFGTHTFYAKIYSLNNPQCFAITSFKVNLNQQPVANQPTEYVICESAPYDGIAIFDFASKKIEVLGNQSAADFSISYHKSLNDANTRTNALSLQYTNTLSQETIYARIENTTNPNCFAVTNFDIKVIQSPSVTQVTNFKQCDDTSNDGSASFDLNTKTTEVLNGQSSTAFAVSYHYSQTDAVSNLNAITSTITNTSQNQTIYYKIYVKSNPNCFVVGTFLLVVHPLPKFNSIPTQMACDDLTNDGKNIFDLTAFNTLALENQNPTNFMVSYYASSIDAQTKTNALPQYYQNTSNPQTIYVRIENKDNTNCYQLGTFDLLVTKMPYANPITNKIQCSNGATSTFTLNEQESALLENQSPNDFSITYHYTAADANLGTNPLSINYDSTTSDQIIYVRIENKLNRNCYTTTSFHIITRQNPTLNMSGIYSICEGSTITVTAPAGYDSYLWSNGETSTQTTIASEGKYTLTVTKTYPDITCNQTAIFDVFKSNIATIQKINILDWNDSQNSISVVATGFGDYEYSIDGVNYQNSPTFNNLKPGNYTVYVKDKKGCGITSEEVYLLSYPKYFTPNNDGYNDKWKIEFSENEPHLTVSIFDRFGKLLKLLNSTSEGWDGTFLNKPLPSNDYWFVVKREDGKEFKGHFTLKR